MTIVLIVASGLSSFLVVPRMEDPELTSRFAIINTVLPGADARRVESLVTEKLETTLRTIDEIKEVHSTSRPGISTITIELSDSIYDVDTVWSQVRDKLDDIAGEMPPDALVPEFEKIKVKANGLIVGIVWKCPSDPNYGIVKRLAKELQEEAERVPDTESVELYGDPDEEYVVTVNSHDLSSLNLTVADIAKQLEASDAKVATGQLRGKTSDLLLEVDSEFGSTARIGDTLISTTSDRVVHLSDIATIKKGVRFPSEKLAFINGKPAVVIGFQMQSDARIDQWTHAVKKVMADFEKLLPDGIGMEVIFEQNDYVDKRLSLLIYNLFLGALAVIVVTLIMLGWRNAIVVSLVLPLSALMVLGGLRFFDIPIHQMSVTGLILALGLLIDSAIVVVDETSERLRQSKNPLQAVAGSVHYLAIPLLGSTLTTAFSFAPIALMKGADGEFVGAIAISVILAISSSFLLAITVVPALTAFLRKSQTNDEWSILQDGIRNSFLLALYQKILRFVFAHPIIGVLVAIVLPILGAAQIGKLPMQLYPPAERNQFHVELELSAHASIQETTRVALQAGKVIAKYPEIANVHWFLGENTPTFYYNIVRRRRNLPYFGHALVELHSQQNATNLVRKLQQDLDDSFPQARLVVRQLEQGPPFEAPIEVRIFGPDLTQLRELGREVREILSGTNGVIHTRAELEELLPKISLEVDEDQARIAGLDHQSISKQMFTSLEGIEGGTVIESSEELPVRVRVSNVQRSNLNEILSLKLRGNTRSQSSMAQGRKGKKPDHQDTIPLSAIASIELTAGNANISRLAGQRLNEIQGFIPAGTLPAPVLRDFKKRLSAANLQLPPGYSISYGGESATRQNAVRNLMANVAILVVLMIATLVLSFSSFRIAIAIFFVALLSAGLSYLALYIFQLPFGFTAIIGTMGLIGIAVNDSIVVMSALQHDPRAREGDHEAVCSVVVRSTRHVLATSVTTIAGFTPLILDGGEFWPPMAISIAGGIGGATLLALFFIPSIHLLTTRKTLPPEDVVAPTTSHAEPALA